LAHEQLAEVAFGALQEKSSITGAVRLGRFDGDPALHHALWVLSIVAVSITKPSLLTRTEHAYSGRSTETE
jgi:hypothetical protein